tara:strand:- start:230 stop:421 length:192 start_codon:yes stop_codon:yes gene_type:complete
MYISAVLLKTNLRVLYSCAYINGSIIVIKATVVMSIIIIAITDKQPMSIIVNRATNNRSSAQA